MSSMGSEQGKPTDAEEFEVSVSNTGKIDKDAARTASRKRGAKFDPKSWHRRASRPVSIWLSLLVVAGCIHIILPEYRWVLIHMLTLGAVTNSIVVWSQHFTEKLLEQPCPPERRPSQLRLIQFLNLGIALTVVGQLATGAENLFTHALDVAHGITVVGAVVVGVALFKHAINLLQQIRAAKGHTKSLTAERSVTVWAYVASAALLPLGALAGAAMVIGVGSPWQGRILLSHTVINVLGFLGFAALASLSFLVPQLTSLSVTEEEAAEQPKHLPRFMVVLVLVGAGVAVMVGGALSGIRMLTLAGLLSYTMGWFIMLAIVAPRIFRALNKGSDNTRGTPVFTGVATIAAPFWLVVALIKILIQLASGTPPDEVDIPTIALVVGFAAQLLLAMMSFLLPATMGGGRRAVAAGLWALDWAGPLRTVILNGGLAVWLLPVASWLKVAISFISLLPLVAVIPLIKRAVDTQRIILVANVMAKKRAKEKETNEDLEADAAQLADQPGGKKTEKPRNTIGQIGTALAAIGLIVAMGSALGAGSGVSTDTAATANDVTPTGNTVRVDVTAKDMRFHPDHVDVEPGDELEIVLTNEDDQDHDLRLANGAESGRVKPGDTVTIEAGAIGGDMEGWCTIAGHRLQGMTFDVNAGGQASESSASGGGVLAEEIPDDQLNPELIRDPVLPPATKEKKHTVEIDVQEIQKPVYEGEDDRGWWTFNGEPMGPILRGKVGDDFEIKFTNSGSMDHSIDFHSGLVSPNEPMRDIAPGEELTYKFTAHHAGMWMYHCGTMPMTMHVAAGMYGAVIIDPPNLDPVDEEFVIVQSEVYGLTGTSEDPVDEERLAANEPSAVVFNGLENQYVQEPLKLKAGDRARFWLLNVGPNKPESFHIVGSQFPTMYKEGAYTVRDQDSGAGQALDLQPAQGGFVEADFPEAGTYTMLNHVFIDAERGAMGHIVVE